MILPAKTERLILNLSLYKWRNRLFLVFAPSVSEKEYREQLRSFQDLESALQERNLLIGEFLEGESGKLGGDPVSTEEENGLRHTFGIPDGRFTVVLVGKDGGEKFRSHEPVSPQDIFDRIDEMPMRRRETNREG